MTTKAGYPEPGEMFGSYRIVRRLGVGGMGVVFEALDTTLARSVALKVISPSVDEVETFRTRFRAEAQGQASLDSPHVVPVFAHGEVDGCLYIATQLVPDGDLGKLIQADGPPSFEVGVEIIAQIAEGLADAHDAGVIHRDLKPPNVLLRRRGGELYAYLADFGIARQVGRGQALTTHGAMLGTPTFMAPELHTGGVAGPASDIYSLGCLLWATLIGKPPYGGTSDYELIRSHVEAHVPQLAPNGPAVEEVNRILRVSMAKESEQRYATAADMRADLRAVGRLPGPIGPVAALARPSSTNAVSSGTAGGRFKAHAVAALIGVVVLAFLGYVAADRLFGDDEPTVSSVDSRGQDLTSAERQVARNNMAEVIAATLPIDLVDADCVTDAWINGVGLEALVEEGFFDDDLNFIDLEEEQMSSETRAAALAAVEACTLG